MAKNMYQKREERKNKPETEKTTTATNINWDNPTNRQLRSNLYKISISLN